MPELQHVEIYIQAAFGLNATMRIVVESRAVVQLTNVYQRKSEALLTRTLSDDHSCTLILYKLISRLEFLLRVSAHCS